ncbi:hypothetical protein N0M98_04560 [Paenibacillus doosanensis]|uniref:Spore coat protein n=1 Tax=Paenibacillus konkukensis TaxID=2020716 RepID=A0ABY4RX17_9BACL|nr:MULTISPECIES: hypothetical protein [Paenibacillus]MCS7459403.1 hypothetical protein [Paenibacillus doosanensis]UQZ87196.1 hypothetical protein SK3146_06493 [Paenibacillus konkukensis]
MNNQQNMTSDRSLLSEKEFSYIKDFLSWELLAMKKCKESAEQCQDAEIKQLIEKTGRQHLDHYQTLLNHLQ